MSGSATRGCPVKGLLISEAGHGKKLACGTASITGSGTVDTGLSSVESIVVTLSSDTAITGNNVSAAVPASGGVVTVKVWKPTAVGDCTPIAATTAKTVNWMAIGK